ncbi:hypothetical protein SAMN05421773_10625 [Streptomyces aidingensis]|uniref:Uncharacterized protein n=1 Tax=Streptomyces aidingensis TaxID=910347 RepID=A0A1I1M9L2_9ACTN|nr:hypothetical protein SAMN05421773_10625 [Streptomyces aidingensis]
MLKRLLTLAGKFAGPALALTIAGACGITVWLAWLGRS